MATHMKEAQAAEYLTVSVSYLRKNRSKSRAEGEPVIPYSKIGGRVVYRKSDLDAHVAKQQEPQDGNSPE